MAAMNRTIVAGLLAAISIGVAVFVATRGHRLERAALDEFHQNRARARLPVDSARYSPLSESLEDFERIAESVEADAAEDGPQRAAALRAAHRFLLSRFVHVAGPESEAAYRAIARHEIERGARLKHADELRFGGSIEGIYEHWVGEQLVADTSAEDIMARLMAVQDNSRARSSVPTGIALSRSAISVSIGRYSLAAPGWPVPTGATNDALAYATSALTHKTLWSRPDSLAAQIRRSGGATVAQVQFFLEFETGLRQPVAVNLVWSGERGEWLVEGTVVGSEAESQNEWTSWIY